MACEQEQQALDAAMLALDTSILSVDAAIAVMKTNIENVRQKQILLAVCRGLQNTNPPNPPGP